MPVCKIDSCKIVIFENKIVEASTSIWVDKDKEILIRALSSEISNADNNANNFSAMPVSWVSDDINLVVYSGIMKILTGTRIGNTEKILTKILSDKIEDVNNIAIGQWPKQ